MKKTFGIIALAALVMLAGCKKNEQPTGTTKLTAGIEQHKSDSKTSLDGLQINWTADDQLYVYDKDGEAPAYFNLISGAGTPTGVFEGSYNFTDENVAVYPPNYMYMTYSKSLEINLPATQTASGSGSFGNGANPMLGVFSEINDFTLTSLCGVLCLQLTGDNVDITAIEIEGGAADMLSGRFKINDYTNPALSYLSNGSNKVTLNFTETVTLTATPQNFYVVLPPVTLTGLTMKVYNGTNVIFTKSTTTSFTAFDITANHVETMFELDVVPTPAPTVPEGALPGKFTVDNTGRQIYFAQGNLQYIGSAATPYWKFADNQWDYLGTTTGQDGTNQNVDRDLFGWGTWTGSNPNPANTSDNDSDYSWDNSDFVKTLQNGSGTWRTLNNDEWGYLFNTRNGATVTTTSGTINHARYTEATINTDGTGVNGIILFPDGVTIASGEATSWGDINLPSAYGTTCTTAQWAALEAKGCVFLPAAGRRYTATFDTYATTVQINGGYYWSSTPDGSDYAWDLYFWESNVIPQNNDCPRSIGHSVRLVQDYN